MFYRRNWCLVRKSARILLTTQLSTFCDPPRKSGIWPILREADQQKCWHFGIWSICQPSKIRHDSGQLEEYFWIAGDRCFHSISLQKGKKIQSLERNFAESQIDRRDFACVGCQDVFMWNVVSTKRCQQYQQYQCAKYQQMPIRRLQH